MSIKEHPTAGSSQAESMPPASGEPRQTTDSTLPKLRALSTRVGEYGDDQLVTLLTKEDVARIFVVCARTVERWVESGVLPAFKFGTHRSAAIRFKVEDVDKLLLSRLRDAKEKPTLDERSSSHPTTRPPSPQGG